MFLCIIVFAGLARGEERLDFQRARELYLRRQAGEKLTAEEEAYLARVLHGREARMPKEGALRDFDMVRARAILELIRRGEAVTEEDRAYLERIREVRRAAERGRTGRAIRPPLPALGGEDSVGLTPLTDLGEGEYKGEKGGLYGEDRNEPPAQHAAAAAAETAKIRPLDFLGRPHEKGKIVLLSVGMSNTSMEFQQFKQMADLDPLKSPHVVIVDGAQGGEAAEDWAANSAGRVWQTVEMRLRSAAVSPQQVQVVWLKQANKRPTAPFPEHARKLQSDIVRILQSLKQKYPNLRIVYLSSRIYGGYATTPLNPEPYAYESGFAVRWVILDQIRGEPELNFDPQHGAVKAALLLWGPYLWADGSKKRADGLCWTREDFEPGDGTHPSQAGRQKVAEQLLIFFKTDPLARSWFARAPH